jgi:predicted ribonuclease toxin of YeeF-YezG toxin-antitoxin module
MKKYDCVKLVLADNGGFIVKYEVMEKRPGASEYEPMVYASKEEIFAEKDLNAAIGRMKELNEEDE